MKIFSVFCSLLFVVKVLGAYTEFYCDTATGANINAGDDAATVTTTTNGSYSRGTGAGGTDVFLATGGTPFSTASVGNWVSVYADGATVATFGGRITAINTGGLSVDISLTAVWGTRPATAATGNSATIGGKWKGPNTASGFPFSSITSTANNTAGDYPRVNFKTGTTYSVTAAITQSTDLVTFEGYTTTAGDGGRATIDGGTSGASYILLTVTGANDSFRNIIFSNSGASGSSTLVSASGVEVYFEGCVFAGSRGNGLLVSSTGFVVLSCEAYGNNLSNTAVTSGFGVSGRGYIGFCIAHDNTGSNTSGFIISGAVVSLSNNIADTNGGKGYLVSGVTSVYLGFCDAYNNTSDGFDASGASATTLVIVGCNFIKNGGWGIQSSGSTIRNGAIRKCGFGAGTQANSSGTINTNASNLAQSGTVTYASNAIPWVDAPNGDFRITLSTAKGAGYGTFVETASSYAGTIGYADIGAAQHQDSGGGGQKSYVVP